MLDFSLFGFSTLKEMYNVHPAFVHMPFGLLPLCLVFYVLGAWKDEPSFFLAGRIALCFGLGAIAITAATGLLAEGSFPHNERIHRIMETHETLGVAALVSTVILVLWSFRQTRHKPKAFGPFLAVLAFTNCLLMQNGDLGSRMVYIEGAAVKPAVSVIAPEPPAPSVPETAPHSHAETHEHSHDPAHSH